MKTNIISSIANWIRLAKPEPTPNDFTTQLGVHFEEVGEMLTSLAPTNVEDEDLRTAMDMAEDAMYGLARAMKRYRGEFDLDLIQRTGFLDSLCDQIVTATGAAELQQMRIAEALEEVNNSNYSKFDDNGQPILDENGKIQKGPNYFKPELGEFA